jgi:hypothetical protein
VPRVSMHAIPLHSALQAPGPCHGPPLGEPHCGPAIPGLGGLEPGFAGLRTSRCSTPTRCCSRPRPPVSAPSSRYWVVRLASPPKRPCAPCRCSGPWPAETTSPSPTSSGTGPRNSDAVARLYCLITQQ